VVAKSIEWPPINANAIEADNAKAMIERADAYLKGQDDGLKGMESRMSSLFGQSVTLASAAIAATATAYAALSHPAGAPAWALPWVARSLAAVSLFWLAAVGVAAWAMLGQRWNIAGMQPRELYDDNTLRAPPNSLRLAIARALQDAIDANTVRALRYSRRLGYVIRLFAAGPIAATIVALCSTQSPFAPLAVCAVAAGVLIWLVQKLVQRGSAH